MTLIDLSLKIIKLIAFLIIIQRCWQNDGASMGHWWHLGGETSWPIIGANGGNNDGPCCHFFNGPASCHLLSQRWASFQIWWQNKLAQLFATFTVFAGLLLFGALSLLTLFRCTTCRRHNRLIAWTFSCIPLKSA